MHHTGPSFMCGIALSGTPTLPLWVPLTWAPCVVWHQFTGLPLCYSIMKISVLLRFYEISQHKFFKHVPTAPSIPIGQFESVMSYWVFKSLYTRMMYHWQSCGPQSLFHVTLPTSAQISHEYGPHSGSVGVQGLGNTTPVWGASGSSVMPHRNSGLALLYRAGTVHQLSPK